MPRIVRQPGVYERTPGSGYWYARYIHEGHKKQKSFGRDRQAAVDFLKDIKARIRLSPEDFRLQQQRQGKGVTIGQLCDQLVEYVQSHPEKYKDQKGPPQRIAYIRAAFGERKAESLTPPEIEAWLASRARAVYAMEFPSRRTNPSLRGHPIACAPPSVASTGWASITAL